MNSITPQELNEAIQQDGNSIIIDVRSEDQHKKCTIKGAINLHPDEIEEKIEDFKKYDHVYLHCNRGGASGRACNYLEKAGLTNVINVEGGLQAWQDAGFDVQCD